MFNGITKDCLSIKFIDTKQEVINKLIRGYRMVCYRTVCTGIPIMALLVYAMTREDFSVIFKVLDSISIILGLYLVYISVLHACSYSKKKDVLWENPASLIRCKYLDKVDKIRLIIWLIYNNCENISFDDEEMLICTELGDFCLKGINDCDCMHDYIGCVSLSDGNNKGSYVLDLDLMLLFKPSFELDL